MKRIAMTVLGVLLIAGGVLGGLRLTGTAQAEDPQTAKAEAAPGDAWQAMHEACTKGDLDAMRGIMEDLGVDWDAMHQACGSGDMSGMFGAMKAAHGGDLEAMDDAMDEMHGDEGTGSHCGGGQMGSGMGGMHGQATGISIEGGRLSPMMGMH
ncbi:MAG: hypothetical protein HY677_06540 [Chloroflexi bacterium]|nr:hypothetical protein [Chloroflexota bacterium]